MEGATEGSLAEVQGSLSSAASVSELSAAREGHPQDRGPGYPGLPQQEASVKIALCIPAYRRQVDIGHVPQALNFGAALLSTGKHSLDFLHTESCSIDWSRNQLLSKAIKRGADWALMCDADTFHPRPAETIAMIDEGEVRGAAVVASPVKMRGRSGYNVFEVANDSAKFVDPESWKGKLISVDRIGTAFFAVNCNWIRTRWPQQPWFTTQQLEGDEPRKIGEDVTFCDRVRERGGLILADGRFEPVHVGA